MEIISNKLLKKYIVELKAFAERHNGEFIIQGNMNKATAEYYEFNNWTVQIGIRKDKYYVELYFDSEYSACLKNKTAAFETIDDAIGYAEFTIKRERGNIINEIIN